MKKVFLGIALVALLSSVAFAFSDDELRAIYAQMKQAGAIKCGMTVEHLIGRHRNCAALGSTACDASLIVVTNEGQCVDSLQFQGLGGPDAAIVLNGDQYPKRGAAPPGKTKPMQAGS